MTNYFKSKGNKQISLRVEPELEKAIHSQRMNTIKPFPTRLSQDLREELERKAKENRRSLNSEIFNRLEATTKLESVYKYPFDELFPLLYKQKRQLKSLEKIAEEYKFLQEEYNKLKIEIDKSFALHGENVNEVAIRKISKAYRYMNEALQEIEPLLNKKQAE